MMQLLMTSLTVLSPFDLGSLAKDLPTRFGIEMHGLKVLRPKFVDDSCPNLARTLAGAPECRILVWGPAEIPNPALLGPTVSAFSIEASSPAYPHTENITLSDVSAASISCTQNGPEAAVVQGSPVFGRFTSNFTGAFSSVICEEPCRLTGYLASFECLKPCCGILQTCLGSA